MISKFSKYFSILSLVIITFSGCQSLFNKGQSEGTIEYKLSMPDSANNSLMASMLPKTMLMRFKDNKTAMEFKAGMGIMSSSFISNPDTRTLSTTMQFMAKKNAFILDEKAVEKQNAKLKLNVKLTDETKSIAGLQCKKAIITDSTGTYDIYYTKEINIKNANWSNPYKNIDGVLMEYRFRIKNMELKLTALNVSGDKVDDAVFTIPAGYKIIKPEDLKKEVH